MKRTGYQPRRAHEALGRVSSRRAKFLFYALFLVAGYLVYHLYMVQIKDGPDLARRAYEQRLETIPLAAQRGTIYDRDGNPMVRSLPSQSVYATLRQVGNKGATARALAPILDVPESDLDATLAGKGAYVLVAHKASRDASDRITKLALPGISVVPEDTGVRFVPSGRLASTVVGFTGFDENGLDGVEYAFDGLLRGSPGKMVLEADQWGRTIPFAQPRIVVAPRPGHGVELTLDSFLQFKVEEILRRTVAKWHAASGTAIVMDPNSGEILALANAPDYDVRDYADYSPDARRDRAVMDAYEPGSTFKLITAAAALESGKVTPDDRFPARDALEIDGSVIHNAEDGFLASTGGSETLEDIIAYSHNVGAAEVGLRIGSRTMFDTMRRFGFGKPTEVGLPGESPGIVPALADWSGTSLPTMSFGHGIAVTPLALARAYCAIANGGVLLRPRILDAVLDHDGNVVYRYEREVEDRVISAKTAAILRRYLRAVVVRGTGDPTARVPGYTTAGKTGTAQVAENGVYRSGAYVASFVGFIPAEAPRFVILVKVDRPEGAIYGSVIAAPAFAEIARIAMMHAGVLPTGPRLVREDGLSKTGI
ncbi:MAG: peptidoglycan D,D-transpeptidase FtsI family protein [Vulcanimicrobiaceae bacterium]